MENRKTVSLQDWKDRREKRLLTREDEEYLLDRLLTEVVDMKRDMKDLNKLIRKLLKGLRK